MQTSRRKAAAALAAALLGGHMARARDKAPGATNEGTQPAANPRVELTTSMGVLVLELDEARAPKTVANFLKYVQDGHYAGTVFHRVIDGFMIQGGGFDADMRQKATQPPVALEIHPALKNDRGTIAMARTGNPNSATSQFFINLVDNDGLNAPKPDGHGYAVFGRVVEGMEVVDKIRAVPTGTRSGHQNVPLEAVRIESAKIL